MTRGGCASAGSISPTSPARQLRTNTQVVLAGKVNLFKGQKTLENPEYEPLESEELLHTGRLVPVYPSTAGLAARTAGRVAREALGGSGDLPRPAAPLAPRGAGGLCRFPPLCADHGPEKGDGAGPGRRRRGAPHEP